MTQPSYAYFDHEADIGIIGRGSTLEAAFEQAAAAMFAFMFDISTIGRTREISLAFEEPDRELALYIWLNQLLTEAHLQRLALGHFKLNRQDTTWHGSAWGDPWGHLKNPGTEVKGATMTMLSVVEMPGFWEARCVVDV